MQTFFSALILGFFIVLFLVKNRNTINFSGAIAWGLIFVFVIILYAFRFELTTLKDRFLAILIPGYSWDNGEGELVISKQSNGHFEVYGYGKNNTKILFLVDTGASDVSLTKEDAQKLGFDLSQLRYTRTYSTANGETKSAPVKIPSLTIGNKTFYNIDANVTSGGLDISLLGMVLISKFNDFKITRDMLILKY